MNRKDMIIVAVLLNVTILSVLFVMAVNSDDPQVSDSSDISREIVVEDKLPSRLPQPVVLVEVDEPFVEDKFELIGDFNSSDGESFLRNDDWALYTDTSAATSEPESFVSLPVGNVIEISVKKGDSLDRIARANGTTVSSIRAINGLKNDHLKIGQKLNIDVGSAKVAEEQRKVAASQAIASRNAVAPENAVYYTVKSGDSPWKIAKQFHVNMDDLLQLNNLDEEKARNLKIGDKIRVR